MQPSFSMTVDVATSIVRITMAGFFEPSDIARFVEARDHAHAKLRCGSNRHVTVVDIRDMRIQTRECVEAFGRVLGDPVHASRALAFVVCATLARAQIQRAAAGRHAAFFSSPEEAERWLREQRASPIASSIPIGHADLRTRPCLPGGSGAADGRSIPLPL